MPYLLQPGNCHNEIPYLCLLKQPWHVDFYWPDLASRTLLFQLPYHLGIPTPHVQEIVMGPGHKEGSKCRKVIQSVCFYIFPILCFLTDILRLIYFP